MTPAAGAGVSIGTIALIGGVVVVAGVVYLLYKNSNKSNNTVSQLVTDEDQYKGDKNIVINAIKEKDWDLLEELLKDKSFQQYPDLIKIVKEALEERK
ncbi:hypothetical protein [Aliarcobacter butzleri]|uniref:hypothetical protein n=1 Tax=Aliarcobacter butzleri TaxID=28197 RepID=UPI002B24A7AF|nr:hypothetical protein [Aliarcobacter butzleri]MCG3717754.1 hypothetical protein [Aliarcobacter butzleri]